ncbi:uncharacterized protein [Watersipora subatra]|uniref:uncharacterized protein n=1 Tax=Watersipora subatra TaxID=2589382 RepID=UPI00355AFA74
MNFEWSVECVREVTLTEESLSTNAVYESNNLDSFQSQSKSKGFFLLDLNGVIISRTVMPSSNNIPEIFQPEVKGLHYPYTLTETIVRTAGGLTVRLYGDSLSLLPLVPGVHYQFFNVEVTVSPPFVAWIGYLTRASVLALKACSVGLLGLVNFERRLMWDVMEKDLPGSPFIVKARILKLIKLDVFVEQSKKTDGDDSVSAKLVMSMDDSSCGFLGICYDKVVAYALGINREAWLEVIDTVKRKGPISIGLGTEEYDEGVAALLRQCFVHRSMQNDREMLVTPLAARSQPSAETGLGSSSHGKTVPFRSCVDRQKNLWATFKTRVHKSLTVKVLNIRI